VRSKNLEVSNISHQKLLLSNLSKALQNDFHYTFSISSTIGKKGLSMLIKICKAI
jgi:hypothetical protein